MNSFCVYILHSEKIGSYYVGTSDNFSRRLIEHNAGSDKTSYTFRGIPWTEFLVIRNLTSKNAYELERKIKSMKSKIFIENLKKYPDLLIKLTSQFK